MLKDHQDAPGLRQGLDLVQGTYGLIRRLAQKADRTALEGGWPVRCLPLPPPQPFTPAERRMLAGSAAGLAGDTVGRFERELARHFGVEHVLAVSSGTAALRTALLAAGIGPGDEVIVPVLTDVGTALAVCQTGAVPRLVDIEPLTWNIDPEQARAALNERTRAILPVHLGGLACDMDALGALARQHGLLLIEDAAQAHGSRLDGRMLGTIGHLGCFSFGSKKTISTLKGGMLMTNDPELARRAREIVQGGKASPEALLNSEGRGPLGALEAALGLGQLLRFEEIMRHRRRQAEFLRDKLQDLPGIEFQQIRKGSDPVFYTLPFVVGPRARLSHAELLRGLALEKIDYRLPSQLPLAQYPTFQQQGSFPVAERTHLARHGRPARRP